MANTTSPLLPATESLLVQLGERLRLARLRRRLQSRQVAERAGMSVVTLRKVERGDPGVTMGAYLAVLQVLQLQNDLEKVGANDPLGRQLQDAERQGGMRIRRQRRVMKSEENSAAQRPEQSLSPSELSAPAEGDAVSGDDLFAFLTSLPDNHKTSQ